jgi:hypothetical protein
MRSLFWFLLWFVMSWKASRRSSCLYHVRTRRHVFQNFKGVVTHLETRTSKQTGMQFDILVKVDMSRQNLLLLIRSLRQSASLGGVTLLADNSVNIKGNSSECAINRKWNKLRWNSRHRPKFFRTLWFGDWVVSQPLGRRHNSVS